MSHITYDEFVEYCKEFSEVSKRVGDDWVLVDRSEYGSLHLLKRETRFLKCKNSPIKETNTATPPSRADSRDQEAHLEEDEVAQDTASWDCGDEMDFEDPSEYRPPKNTCEDEAVTFEYNVVYSISHSVPLLCFEVFDKSGKPLTMEEVWLSVVDCSFFKQVYHNRWETLTMGEHPIKGSSCYMIHPCRTADVMKQVQRGESSGKDGSETVTGTEAKSMACSEGSVKKLDGSSYLISWLSMVGSVIGLKIGTAYFMSK